MSICITSLWQRRKGKGILATTLLMSQCCSSEVTLLSHKHRGSIETCIPRVRSNTQKGMTSFQPKPLQFLLQRPVPGPLALWYLSSGVWEGRGSCFRSARCRRLRTFLHHTVQVCAKFPMLTLKELVWLTSQHCAEMLTDVLEAGTAHSLNAPNSSISWAQLETAKQHDHGGTGNLWQNNC